MGPRLMIRVRLLSFRILRPHSPTSARRRNQTPYVRNDYGPITGIAKKRRMESPETFIQSVVSQCSSQWTPLALSPLPFQ